MEIVFVNVNPQSTLLLGQARGAALAALVAGGLPVAEYTALQMKKAVVGHGLATKAQVQAMVMRLLALPRRCRARTPPTRSAWRSRTRTPRSSFAAIARAAPLARKAHAQYKRGRTY